MKKKIIALLMICLLILSVTACTGSGDAKDVPENVGDTYEWTVSSGLAVGSSWDQGLLKFADLLSEKSDGAIKLTVYSGGTLGSAKEALEGVQMGSIDFIVESSASLSNFTDAMAVYDLPYLFKNKDVARSVLSSDVALDQLAKLEEVGLKGINYWENGIYAVGSKTPLNSLADFNGKRIRSIDSALQADIYNSFGANGVVLTWGDIYTSLQQGVIDGVSSTTVPNMFSANFYEVAPYITLTNHGYSPAPLIANLDLWNSLPEEIQNIVMESAEEARQYEYEVCDDILANCQAEMEAKGATFIEVDTDEFAAAVAPIYEKYVGADGIDPEIVDAMKAEAAKFKN